MLLPSHIKKPVKKRLKAYLLLDMVFTVFKKGLVVIIAIATVENIQATVENRSAGYSIPTLHPTNVLNSSLGVRSFGMGEAQTGRADDLSSMYYNIAGLAQMNYWEAALSHKGLTNDVDGNSFMMNIPTPIGVFGTQFTYYSVRDNEHVENGSNSHPDRERSTYLVGLSYARNIVQGLKAGLTLKYTSANFSKGTPALGFAEKQRGIYADIGLLYNYDLSKFGGILHFFPDVGFGLSARNLHPKFGIPDEINSNAEEYVMGMSIYYAYNVTLNLDLKNRRNEHMRYHFGIEWWPFYFIALRVGMVAESPERPYIAYHWGLGLGETVGETKNLSFEYAGQNEQVNGIPNQSQTYHRIAVHLGFEKVANIKGPYNKTYKLKIAESDRYNTPLQFALEQQPEEIVSDSALIAILNKDKDKVIEQEQETETATTTVTTTTNDNGRKKPVKKPVKFKKRVVGMYPFSYIANGVSTSADEESRSEIPKKIRRAILLEIIAEKTLKSMKEKRYGLTPQKREEESDIEYAERLCQFHFVDALGFGSLVQEGNGKYTIKITIMKRGAKSFSGVIQRTGKLDEIKSLAQDLAGEFVLNVKEMLKIRL